MDDDAAQRRNRSSEEFDMRRAIEAWGRPIMPNARVVHELVVAQECRIDMAFIGPDYLVGVEIKSSRDTLDRLDNQWRVFRNHLPCVYVAVAPKWIGYEHHIPRMDKILCDVTGDAPRLDFYYHHPLRDTRRQVTVQMLELLWAAEARAIAIRKRLDVTKSTPLYKMIPIMARALTGDEIVREVCRELRARDAFPKAKDHPPSDPPTYVSASDVREERGRT